MRTTSTKNFFGYPCAHRQWRDKSHCNLVHGYSRSFHFEFGAMFLDDKGWVVPFGGLDDIKKFLAEKFDHTFLVAPDDPEMDTWKALHERGALNLVVLPYGPSMEGTAHYVFDAVNAMVRKLTNERCCVLSVEVRENEKNSAIYSVGL